MPETGHTITILDPGALTTVQDAGRPGLAHLGVPRSGAADAASYALANRLVGNPAGSAALETTLTGCTLRLARSTRLAVTGATCRVDVDGRAMPWGSAVVAPAGATVRVGPAETGLRSYVAVAGGLCPEPVLGSRATDVLSGLGPAPLGVGSLLPIGGAGEPAAWVEVAPVAWGDREVEVVPGPRFDWFHDASAIDGAVYTVTSDSNRIGLRLEGAELTWARQEELESEAMVLGAIQVPPSGQPVILLADHATTGGYPVIGVVRDVAPLGQARPGDRLTLRRAR